jgi:hypothetical protein
LIKHRTQKKAVFGPAFRDGGAKEWAECAVLSSICPCDSPFLICRHVITLLIYISRVSEECYKTSTSGEAYWRGAGGAAAPIAAAGKPALLKELQYAKVYLSDVAGKDAAVTAATAAETAPAADHDRSALPGPACQFVSVNHY